MTMREFDFIIENAVDVDRRSLEDDGWADVVFVVADTKTEESDPGCAAPAAPPAPIT